MSLLETLFTEHPREIGEANIKEIVQDLNQDKDITTNLIDLTSASKKYGNIVAIQATPVLFKYLNDKDKYKQFITQILTILLNILNGENGSSNCLNILEQKDSIPILLQYARSDMPQNRILVLRILSCLAMHQLELLQSILISTEDNLPNLLSLVRDKNKMILQEFLDFICVSIQNNLNFQQIVAFNILDSLVELLRQGNDKVFAPLIAILKNNSISQAMFYSSSYLNVVSPYVRNKTVSSLAFLRTLFQDPSFPKHQQTLESTTFFAALLEVSMNDQRFLEILSLATKNSEKLTQKVYQKGTLKEIVMNAFTTDALSDELLAFFAEFDGSSDILKILAESSNKINNDNLPNLLIVLETLIIKDNDCKSLIAKNSLFSKILTFLDGPNMSKIIVFIATECWKCNGACYSFFENSTKIENSYNNLEIVIAAENISMDNLSHFASFLILASLYMFSDSYSENLSKLVSIDEIKAKILSLRENIIKESENSPVAQNLISISYEIVEDPPKIVEEVKEEPEITEQKPEIQEQNENIISIPENKPNVEENNLNESTSDSVSTEIQMTDEKSDTSQIETNNHYRDYIIEKSRRQEAEKRYEDLMSQLKFSNDELNKKISQIQNSFNTELQNKQKKVTELESTIDTITVNSQKEINDLKKKYAQFELQSKQQMSKLKNDKNEEIIMRCSELKEGLEKIKMELALFESSNRALMSDKIDEIADLRKYDQQIQEENKSLKFKISQLERRHNFFQEELNKSQKRINELQNEKDSAESKCLQFSQELLVIRNSFRSGDHQNLLSIIDSQRSTIVSMTGQLETQKSLIYDLRSQIENFNSSKSQLTAKIHELESLLGNEKSDKKKLEGLLMEQKEENHALNESLKAVVPERDTLLVSNEEIKVKSRRLEIEIKNLMDENDDLKRQIGKNSYEKEYIIINGDGSASNSSELQKLLDIINEKDSIISSQRLEFESQIRDLHAQKIEFETTIKELQSQNSELENTIQELQTSSTFKNTQKLPELSGLQELPSIDSLPLTNSSDLQNSNSNNNTQSPDTFVMHELPALSSLPTPNDLSKSNELSDLPKPPDNFVMPALGGLPIPIPNSLSQSPEISGLQNSADIQKLPDTLAMQQFPAISSLPTPDSNNMQESSVPISDDLQNPPELDAVQKLPSIDGLPTSRSSSKLSASGSSSEFQKPPELNTMQQLPSIGGLPTSRSSSKLSASASSNDLQKPPELNTMQKLPSIGGLPTSRSSQKLSGLSNSSSTNNLQKPPELGLRGSSSINDLQNSLNDLRKSNIVKDEQIQSMINEKSHYEQIINELNDEIYRLKKDLEVANQNAKLAKQYYNNQADIVKRTISERSERMFEQFENLAQNVQMKLDSSSCDHINRGIQNLKTQNSDMKLIIKDMTDRMNNRSPVRAKPNKTILINEINSEIIEVKKQISEIKAYVNQMVSQSMNEMNNIHKGIRERIVFILKLLYKYKKQKTSLKLEITQYKAEIKKYVININNEKEKTQKLIEIVKDYQNKQIETDEKLKQISTNEKDIKDLIKINDEYKKKIDELQQTIKDLQQGYSDDLEKCVDKYEKKISDLQQKSSDDDKTINELQKLVEENEDELNGLQVKFDDLQKDSSENEKNYEEKIKNLQNIIENGQKRMKDLENIIVDNEKMIKDLQSNSSNDVKKIIDEYEKKISNIQTQISNDYENKFAKISQELENLRRQNNSLSNELDSSNKKVKSEEVVNEKLRKDVESLQNQLQQSNQNEEAMQKLIVENEKIKLDFKSLQEKFESENQKFNICQTEKNDIERKYVLIEKKYNEIASKAISLEKELQDAKNQIKELDSQKSSLETEKERKINELMLNINILTSKLEITSDRVLILERSETENEELKRRIVILENQADVFRANERRLQRKISDLKEKLSKFKQVEVKDDTKDLQEMLEESERKCAELQRKLKETEVLAKSAIKRLTIEVEANSQIKEKDDKTENVDSTVKVLSDEITDLKQKLIESERKCHELESSMKLVIPTADKEKQKDDDIIEVLDIANFEGLSDSEFRKRALIIIGKLWLEKVSKSHEK